MRAAPWIAVYRRLLSLLPAFLRDKHGEAMVSLYARELEHARTKGAWHLAAAGVAGLYDLLRRSAVESVRARTDAASAPRMRALGVAFAESTVALTFALLALFGGRTLPRLAERGESVATIVEALLLAVPFTIALTLPMAVLLTVLLVRTRRASRNTAPARLRGRHGLVPILASATAVAALTLVVTTQVVPRTNGRLTNLLAGGPVETSDRSMTVSALQAAARATARAGGSDAAARVAAYEVEIHKKYALAAACLVLAVVGLAITQRAPSGGTLLVVTASCTVYAVYAVLLTGGETLAEQQVISPLVGTWSANALLLTAALLAMRWHSNAHGPTESEAGGVEAA